VKVTNTGLQPVVVLATKLTVGGGEVVTVEIAVSAHPLLVPITVYVALVPGTVMPGVTAPVDHA
jgi:hypothetical protein